MATIREERLWAELEVEQAALALKAAQLKLAEIKNRELKEKVNKATALKEGS